MNILFVLEYYTPHLGGIQVVFENIAERLVDRGHNVKVVTARTGDTASYERRNGVEIYRSAVIDSLDRYTFTATGIPGAMRRAGDADIIHTSTWTGAAPAWLIKQLTGTPSILTVHEVFAPVWDKTDMGLVSRSLHKLLERGIYQLPFDQYTVVSEYTKNCLVDQGKDPVDIDVIYNGIDNELFSPEQVDRAWMKQELGLEGQFVYTYFGRPGPFKGVEYLVRAVPKISDMAEDTSLLLILGHQPEDRYERILSLISELGIQDRVCIIDPVEREILPQYVGGADCVVIPSISEGFGFTAAEACALEVPVVATTAGALPETVSGDHILVDPANPEAIADGVLDIYRGEHDTIPKKEFRWERAVDEYIDLYESMLWGG